MYSFDKWRDRSRGRSDMSVYLTHLTRASKGGHGNFPRTAVDNLIDILKERKIRASGKGFINSGEPVVCFQDTPIYGVSQNVKHEMLNLKELGGRVKYEPVGISFPKTEVFKQGGRPVIYEKPTTIDGKKVFPDIDESLLWRVVSHDLSDYRNIIDWTHEREWRIKGDFDLELQLTYVLLADGIKYREFIEKVDKEILEKIAGVIVLEGILY